MYSNLLAAKAAGKKISIWYAPATAPSGSTEASGCTDAALAEAKGIAQT
jgi:hypothetical protein